MNTFIEKSLFFKFKMDGMIFTGILRVYAYAELKLIFSFIPF